MDLQFVNGTLSFAGGWIYTLGTEHYPPQVALTPRPPANKLTSHGDGGFHTSRSGIDLRGGRFCPRFVEIADIWKDIYIPRMGLRSSMVALAPQTPVNLLGT